MSNLLLGWPNRLYRATLSGGNWLSALPLANLQNGDAEAGTVYELMRRLGTVEEVLCLPDLSDLPRCQRFGFIGTLSELSDIAHPRFNNNSVNMQIEEWL